MSNKYLLGFFEDDHKLVEGAKTLKARGIKIADIFTPFPVHGLDELLDINRTNLPWVTLIAGTIGLVVAIGFQVWSSNNAWPINVGGKPFLSIPAFVPIAFEITVLFGALTTVAAFFCKSKLFPGKEVKLMHKNQTDDMFVLAVPYESGEYDFESVKKILLEKGAKKVEFSN